MPVPILRAISPRLYHPADDPDFRFDLPRDPVRRRILKNILADCEGYASQRPWKRIPERLDSPHPYHQLYITFYTGMHATALTGAQKRRWSPGRRGSRSGAGGRAVRSGSCGAAGIF